MDEESAAFDRFIQEQIKRKPDRNGKESAKAYRTDAVNELPL